MILIGIAGIRGTDPGRVRKNIIEIYQIARRKLNCTASANPAASLSERSGDLSAFGGSRLSGLRG